MKKRIFSLLLALVMAVSLLPVSAFAADDYELRVLTFEDADYKGGTNFANGNDWSSLIDDPQYGGKLLYGSGGAGVDSADEAYQWTDTNNTWLHNILSEGYGSWCYWSGGHAISNYNTGDIEDYGGFKAQLTVYKKGVSGLSRTGGGHNGSNNFAVHYGYADNSGYGLSADALPALTFADGPERVIDHMYVTNTTYALNCYIDGNGLTAKIGPDDWVKLVATGYDTKGAKTGETVIYLCNGPDNIIMDWTKWDLSSLGKVAKVTFNVTGSSDNGYGFSQPAYFAYDDVAVRFEKAGADVPATGVTLSETALSLHPTEKATLAATVAPENTTDTLVWTSSNDAVATVKDGVVTAKSEGTATITAACGSAKAECVVTVLSPIPATGVTLDKTALKLYEGDAAKLTAMVKPEDTTDKTIVWTSSDKTIATVKDGTVTAVNEALLDDPAQVNEAPYEAWLIKVSEVSDTEELLDAEGYAAVVAAEEG